MGLGSAGPAGCIRWPAIWGPQGREGTAGAKGRAAGGWHTEEPLSLQSRGVFWGGCGGRVYEGHPSAPDKSLTTSLYLTGPSAL